MTLRHVYPVVLCLGLIACGGHDAHDPNTTETSRTGGTGLRPFESEQAFDALLEQWEKAAEKRAKSGRDSQGIVYESAPLSAVFPPPSPASAEDSAAASSITNVQTAGVDEGGIVKRHGDHLVILRRGRLFTVHIGDDQLQPVSSIDAFSPDVNPQGTWYDEMLISDDTVVVIGYSYSRGGTELVLFDIDRNGGLRYRDTWHLRSHDYYSSRNYASRLIGSTLVLYTPSYINAWNLKQRDFMPALRRWTPQATPEEFKRILPATRIYRTDEKLDPLDDTLALHSVIRCDLSAPELDCTSSAILGPSGRVFYVSADSVFVWTVKYQPKSKSQSAVFRIPLDDSTPTALKTRGTPIDQMSFLHDSSGHLNVLLSETGRGEGMWGARTSTGKLSLLRVALDSFDDGRSSAPDSAYRPLPGDASGAMQNRYVGDWLLYGSAPYSYGRQNEAKKTAGAHAVRYADAQEAEALSVSHAVERIEAMGNDAILVGSADTDLHFSSVRLGANQANVGSTFVQAGAAQGESRSHGFFYKAESAEQGIVGLPVLTHASGHGGVYHRHYGSAAVLYLRNNDLELSPLGELQADHKKAVDDQCRASCVDWYGNARPIFIGDRVFALVGYELVEGRVIDERIVERQRSNFAPQAALIAD